jgi:hypothetical protein
MNREEALAQLACDSAHDRLKAARFLARNSEASDIEYLSNALNVETVAYVRTSLNLAIQRVANTVRQEQTIDTGQELQIPADLRMQIKNEVTEQLTRQILHEISSPVGLIGMSAQREIQDFEHSKTKTYLDSLRRVFDAIEQLKVASSVPKPTEFDLAGLLSEIVMAEAPTTRKDVTPLHRKPGGLMEQNNASLQRGDQG